jgi:hypothetical protein
VTSIRFAWRLDPVPLAFVVIGGLGLALGAVAAAGYLHGIAGPGCAPPLMVTCGSGPDFVTFSDAVAGRLAVAIGVMPFVAGAILGAPIVARELERRTAAVAWSLEASRDRWLVWRVAPVIGLLVIFLLGLALAGDRLTAERIPLQDPTRTFIDFGLRGPLIVARGLVVFAVAVFAGILSRRVLPALLLAVAFSFALAFVSDATRTIGVAWTEIDGYGECVTVGCVRSTEAFRDPDGQIIPVREVLAIAGAAGIVGDTLSDSFKEWAQLHGYVEVSVAITGERYPEVEGRELAVTATLALVVAAGSVVALRRAVVS